MREEIYHCLNTFLFQAYRCYVIWGYNKLIMVVPIIMIIASTGKSPGSLLYGTRLNYDFQHWAATLHCGALM